MAIRLPSVVKQITDTTTTGVTNYDFLLPQDTDNVVVKLYTGTFTGTNPTLDVYVQTTDDGGATWYDMGHFPQSVAAVSKSAAQWAFFSTLGGPKRTQGASVLDIGNATSSSIGVGQYTGLPLLGQLMRIAVKIGGTQVANAGTVITVLANNQSATA